MMTIDRINTAFDALKMAAEAAGLNVQEVENMRLLAIAGLSQPKDAARFAWLIEQTAPTQDAVLRPPIPPETLESPEKWRDIIRAAIDARIAKSLRRQSPS